MFEMWRVFESTGTDSGSGLAERPVDGRRETLSSGRRTDRAGVNGIVPYVLLGAMVGIGSALLANVLF